MSLRMMLSSVAAILILFASSASAVAPLEITDVTVDESTNQIQIVGINFDNGSSLEFWLGGEMLTIVSRTFDPCCTVVAMLPADIEPGSYQLVATTGGGSVRYNDFDGVTIGNQGPAGPRGLQGDDGPQGIAGISCWDSNNNRVKDTSEDINGDGKVDSLDCRGDVDLSSLFQRLTSIEDRLRNSDFDNDGYSPFTNDCNDSDQSINPSVVEECGDGVDNNCNGVIDEECASQCIPGQVVCGNQCVDLSTDGNNCGGCGNVCTGDQLCVSGLCSLPTCGLGEVACGDTCADLATDKNNCGGCGNVCTGDQLCVSGQCSLPTCGLGEVACGDTCADLASDKNNCGTCGNVCTGDQLCQSGQCYLPTCGLGEVACGDTCADLATDANNCGTCGNMCPGNDICVSGTCSSP